MAVTPGRPLVLVVEDEAAIREVLSSTVQQAGFEVVSVDMAQKAMEAVRTHRPDLIVLDLGMPRGTMQGMEFLAVLREDPAWQQLPVLILSGYGDIVNRDVTGRLGVRAVLSKPMVDFSVLVRAIKENLPPAA